MKNFIKKILVLIFVGIFIFSSYNLYKIFNEYKKNKDSYKEINEIVIKEDTKGVSEENSNNIGIGSKEYAELKAINED